MPLSQVPNPKRLRASVRSDTSAFMAPPFLSVFMDQCVCVFVCVCEGTKPCSERGKAEATVTLRPSSEHTQEVQKPATSVTTVKMHLCK